MFDGAAKLKNGSLITFYCRRDRFGKEFIVKNLIISNNNLQGSMYYYGKQLLMIDNKVYKLNNKKELKLKDKNVKYIGDGYLII